MQEDESGFKDHGENENHGGEKGFMCRRGHEEVECGQMWMRLECQKIDIVKGVEEIVWDTLLGVIFLVQLHSPATLSNRRCWFIWI